MAQRSARNLVHAPILTSLFQLRDHFLQAVTPRTHPRPLRSGAPQSRAAAPQAQAKRP
jgi:hypothetical protein